MAAHTAKAPNGFVRGLHLDGVSDGARTRDPRDHNAMLYQLSYAHHRP